MKKDKIHTQGVNTPSPGTSPVNPKPSPVSPSRNPLNVGGPKRKYSSPRPSRSMSAGFNHRGWKKVKVDYGLNTKGRGGHFFISENHVPHRFHVKTIKK